MITFKLIISTYHDYTNFAKSNALQMQMIFLNNQDYNTTRNIVDAEKFGHENYRVF